MKNLNLLLICFFVFFNSYSQLNKTRIFSNNDLEVFFQDGKLNLNYNQKSLNKIDVQFADTLQIKSRKLVNKFSNIEFDKLAKEFYNNSYNENENFLKLFIIILKKVNSLSLKVFIQLKSFLKLIENLQVNHQNF